MPRRFTALELRMELSGTQPAATHWRSRRRAPRFLVEVVSVLPSRRFKKTVSLTFGESGSNLNDINSLYDRVILKIKIESFLVRNRVTLGVSA